MHITCTHKTMQNRQASGQFNPGYFPAIIFSPSTPRSLEMVGRGCISLNNSLGLLLGPEPVHGKPGMPSMCEKTSCCRGRPSTKRKGCWHPSAVWQCYSRRAVSLLKQLRGPCAVRSRDIPAWTSPFGQNLPLLLAKVLSLC